MKSSLRTSASHLNDLSILPDAPLEFLPPLYSPPNGAAPVPDGAAQIQIDPQQEVPRLVQGPPDHLVVASSVLDSPPNGGSQEYPHLAHFLEMERATP